MRRQFFHVKDQESVSFEDLAGGQKRKIREMFMVNRIELVACNQLQQMRKLHRNDALLAQDELHAADEVADIGHLCEHVVPDEQVGHCSFSNQLARRLTAEEGHACWNALPSRHCRHVGCRFDAERRNSAGDEVLKEIAVITGELDDLMAGRAHEASDAPLIAPTAAPKSS